MKFPIGSIVECSWDGVPHQGVVVECPTHRIGNAYIPDGAVWAHWDTDKYPLYVDSDRYPVIFLKGPDVDVGDLEDDL